MKLAAGATMVGAVALTLGGAVRIFARPCAEPWVRQVFASDERRRHDAEREWQRRLDGFGAREIARGDGGRRFLYGPLRVVWAESVRMSDDAAAAELADATHVRGGWIFRDVAGNIYRSDTFLGPLHQMSLPRNLCVEAIQPDVVVVYRSFGRAVIPASRGLYSSDGGPFTRLDAQVPIWAAAFGTPDWGLGLADGGRVFETRDGGRHWAPLGAIDEHVSELEGFNGGVRYRARQWRVLRADGTTRPEPSDPPVLDDDEQRRIVPMFRARALSLLTLTRPSVPCRGDHDDDDEHLARLSRVIAVRAQSGARHRRLMGAMPAPERRYALGYQAIVTAPPEISPQRRKNRVLWRFAGGQTFAVTLPSRAADVDPLYADDDAPSVEVRAVTRTGIVARLGEHLHWIPRQGTNAREPSMILANLREPLGLSWPDPWDEPVRAFEDRGFLLWVGEEDKAISNRRLCPGSALTAYRVACALPAGRTAVPARLWRCVDDACTSVDWHYDRSWQGIVGAVRRADAWGIVGFDLRQSDSGARWHRIIATQGFDDVAAVLQRVLGPARGAGVPITTCGASVGGWEVQASYPETMDHLASLNVEERGSSEDWGGLEVGRVVLEPAGEGICLRRIEAVSHRPTPATLWLDARDGALVGGMDDGATITELRGTLAAPSSAP